MTNDDRPATRGYARIERERRFALDALPATLDLAVFERLHDLYVEGTELRLRRVEAPDGTRLQVKLGQKTLDPDAPGDPRHRRMTTLYLREGDERALASLQGLRSVKRRYKLAEQGWTFCIDVYESPGGAAGTMLCEVECDSDAQLERITCPSWATREVTEDARYSGHTLASLGDATNE